MTAPSDPAMPAAAPGAVDTVAVPVAGTTLHLAAGKHQPFYATLADGTWEPETFRVLRENLDADTVFLDVGAWIGVTPFYGAQFARRVVAVEPDPAAVAILEGLRGANPGEVTVLNAAVAAAGQGGTVDLHAVKRWGSSMSTVVADPKRQTGETQTTKAVTLDALVDGAGDAPVFIKMDIEGGEYAVADQIAALDARRLRGFLLAVHPQILAAALGGPLRRLRAAWRTWRLLGAVPLRRARVPGTDRPFRRLGYVLGGILFSRFVRGANVLFTSE